MTVLAIDTSSRGRAVCVLASPDGRLVEADVREGVAVGETLPRSLAALLGDEVSAVVVVDGPGSYTGIRAGLAAALGVAHARGLPLHRIGALEVISAAVPPARRPCWIAADAGRGAVYIAREPGLEPRRVAAASLALDGLAVFSADGLPVAGLVRVEPAIALAAAAPLALRRGRTELSGLTGVYVV